MLCLNYLLKLQFLQSMRPLTSAKQANMSFGLRLSSDVVCPTDLLAAQVCDSSSDVLRLFFAEGTWRKKEEKRQPRSPCSWIENIHQINISIGHQSTEQSVVKLAWCICGGSFSTQDLAPQLLKTPKSDYHHILLLCQALLVSLFVFVCLFFSPPKHPCCTLSPDLSREHFVHCSSSTAEIQAGGIEAEEWEGLIFKGCHAQYSSGSKSKVQAISLKHSHTVTALRTLHNQRNYCCTSRTYWYCVIQAPEHQNPGGLGHTETNLAV